MSEKAVKVRVHVFADHDGFRERLEIEESRWKNIFSSLYRQTHGVPLDVTMTASMFPDFADKAFDVLMFDYGGMAVYGDTVGANDASRAILKDAEEHPSRDYVMVSIFTRRAMEDFLEREGKDFPANVHLDVDEYEAALERGEIVFG